MTFGDIKRAFAAPALDPGGITFNGRNLLVACQGDLNIHEVDRKTGASIKSFPFLGPVSLGLQYIDGGYLLKGTGISIINLTDLEGHIIRTFPGVAAFVYGITYTGGGTIIQLARPTTHNDRLLFREFSRLAPEIKRVQVNPSSVHLAGLCHDGKDLYSCVYSGAFSIKKYSIDGCLIESAWFPNRPLGITTDEKDLWVVNDVTDLIYCVSMN